MYWLCSEQSLETQRGQECSQAVAEALVSDAVDVTGRQRPLAEIEQNAEARETVLDYYASRGSCEQQIPRWQATIDKYGAQPPSDAVKRLAALNGKSPLVKAHMRCDEKNVLP